MNCYRDKERKCDNTCMAYSLEDIDGNKKVHCAALDFSREFKNLVEDFICSRDIHSFFLKVSAGAMDSLKETFKAVL